MRLSRSASPLQAPPRSLPLWSALLWLLPLLPAPTLAGETVTHRLRVALDPAAGSLRVADEIELAAPAAGPVDFLLNAELRITASSGPLETVPAGDPADLIGSDSGLEVPAEVRLARYRWSPAGATRLSVAYEGKIDYGLSDQREEYTRGFRETAGMISPEGIYLAAGSFWIPTFGDEVAGFALEVEHPEGWRVISQGEGPGEAAGSSRWTEPGPVLDGIYLVGGPLLDYREAAGEVEAQVYLREADDALAQRYLEATGQYLEMYRRLIGAYPYPKFALVENFWETGYGMPSFTLLGPRVIRFPFILHSSYPHEILHNWWGNSVFVDYSSGNWSEGLTAYLADHLVKEQRGEGAEHRRATLQKYRDYVREGRDFPLAEFTSRHSAASEAVGYGKTMMGFHMLRRRLGDRVFTSALQALYRDHRGARASFRDLQAVFESASGQELDFFFDPWITRPGAAELTVEATARPDEEGGWTVSGALEQRQPGEPWPLEVPLALETAAGLETVTVRLEARRASFELRAAAEPRRLLADPWFDLFRLLDPRETPPSIGQIFGEPEILAVLPAAAPPERLARYRELLEGWRSDSHAVELRGDDEVAELPADRSVWIVGRENRLAGQWFGEWRAADDAATLGGERVPFAGHSLVAVRRHPATAEHALGWLVVDPEAAFPGMGRKLPHYGKYSYLAFTGEAPDNIVKGQSPAGDSPLAIDLRPEAARDAGLGPFPVPERTALAELPPLFSPPRLMEHVRFLSAEALEGRGLGTAGLEEAARYIAARFGEYGLQPGGEEGGFFQRVPIAAGPDGEPGESVNVIGYLPGSRQEWADQSVVVGAHFDHLGRGWPDVHAGDEGAIHPGADDNASGMAVLLELARTLAGAGGAPRALVFAAFTGEEAGRLGSRRFVEGSSPRPLEGIRAMVNLDTVGRLGDGEVSVLGTGTADEWQHIFRGSSFVTGVPSRNVPGSDEASDQLSFIEKGVPAVQIFTRAHPDYHRPGDTADKVDGAGLARVAALVREAVVYLGEREEPLTTTLGDRAAEAAPAPAAPSGRRVRFGTIPDFAYPGPGARIESVAPDSPAERAGLAGGDVLLSIDGREVTGLRGYSEILKTLEPGQTVTVVVRRGGDELDLQVTVEAR